MLTNNLSEGNAKKKRKRKKENVVLQNDYNNQARLLFNVKE